MITLVTSSGQSVGLTFLVHSIYFQTLFSKKLEQMGWKWQMWFMIYIMLFCCNCDFMNAIYIMLFCCKCDSYYVILLQMWFINNRNKQLWTVASKCGWRYSNCRANEVFVKSEEAGDGLSYWTVVWYKLDKRERGGVNKLELSFAVSEGWTHNGWLDGEYLGNKHWTTKRSWNICSVKVLALAWGIKAIF